MPIRRTQKGWKIDNVPGYHKSRKSAEKQLAAIKLSQKKREKN